MGGHLRGCWTCQGRQNGRRQVAPPSAQKRFPQSPRRRTLPATWHPGPARRLPRGRLLEQACAWAQRHLEPESAGVLTLGAPGEACEGPLDHCNSGNPVNSRPNIVPPRADLRAYEPRRRVATVQGERATPLTAQSEPCGLHVHLISLCTALSSAVRPPCRPGRSPLAARRTPRVREGREPRRPNTFRRWAEQGYVKTRVSSTSKSSGRGASDQRVRCSLRRMAIVQPE